MPVLGRILAYARPYWAWGLAGLASMLVGVVLGLAVPWLIRVVIDDVAARGQYGILKILALAVIGVTLLRGLVGFAERYSMEYLAQRAIYDLRNDLYRHLQELSFSFYDRARTGQLMSRVSSDVETMRRFLGFGLINLASNAITLLAVMAVLLTMHWRLALLSLATLPALVGTVLHFGHRVGPVYQGIQERLGELTAVLQENVTGARVVRAFAREREEISRFRRQNQAYMAENLKAVRLWAAYFPLMNVLAGLGIAVLLWYGGREVISGNLSLGSLVAFNMFLGLLIVPLRMLGWMWNLAEQAVASGRRVVEILDTRSQVRDLPGAVALPRIRGEVRFEGVCLSHAGRQVLADVDLVVRPGETVALVGATGSGKSSLVQLIPRFYDPNRGRVTIDGHDIRGVTLESLRRQIGVVLQDTFLFSTTIHENIAYGRPGASRDEVIRVARAARIHEFILSLPAGYETLVGERGVNLSGGQKQRVAIARALLLDPRILILDDATSNVDSQTETLIQEALSELLRGRTAFIIAHRAGTLLGADRVVVLDGGRIVQEGRHNELLAADGPYRRLLPAARGV